MTIVWIIEVIGITLGIIDIFLYKYSRYDDEPLLKVWSLLLIIIISLIPMINIIINTLIVAIWWVLYYSENIETITSNNRFIKWLNKRIS